MVTSAETSDDALVTLLNRLKPTVDQTEIRELSQQIERVIFHKQWANILSREGPHPVARAEDTLH